VTATPALPETAATRPPRIHRAWVVAAVAFVALIGAAGFRATPGVLIVPLQEEFGWSRAQISLAVTVNLLLFGLTAPFAAALMDRYGMRRVVTCALLLVAGGSAMTIFMTARWELVLGWGVLVGLGTGSMALVFAATVANRWFVRSRGLVVGVLTAGGATGQLIFLPILALLAQDRGWRAAALVVALAALAVVPLVLLLLRDRPSDLGLLPYGGQAPDGTAPVAGVDDMGPARRAVAGLAMAARTRAFWLLAGGFAICGASTNGLVGTHFIPAAHDHGMAGPTAAGLLALVGIFDVVGTIGSGWLTDRVDSRLLLGGYYALRGLSLLALPALLTDSVQPSMLVFIIFYGLDWVATVPPTVALCRQVYGPEDGTVVFGWVFAAHQVGAAAAAGLAGLARTSLGTYDLAWFVAGGLCLGAAVLSVRIAIPARPVPTPSPAPVPGAASLGGTLDA
jgi:predicted MFS family arabinose efflux permease